MRAGEVQAALYGRRQSAEPSGADSSAGGGQDLGIHVEGKEDWHLSVVPMESGTGVRSSLRVEFDAICARCRESGLEVPENANKVFSLAWRGVGAIAEREGNIGDKNAVVVARDSVVKERVTAREEIVKLEAIVDASAQNFSALKDRVLKLTVDRDVLSCNLVVA